MNFSDLSDIEQIALLHAARKNNKDFFKEVFNGNTDIPIEDIADIDVKSVLDNAKDNYRYVVLSDLSAKKKYSLVIATNISKEVLKAMEQLCNALNKDGYDLPLWNEFLDDENEHILWIDDDFIEENGVSSDEYIKENYPYITERYIIKDLTSENK